MATAAAGGAGQEKQLAPTLLSFFIYNPKLGPKEGEVPERGVASRGCGERRAASRPGSVPGSVAAGAGASVSALPSLPEAWAAACARGINASPLPAEHPRTKAAAGEEGAAAFPARGRGSPLVCLRRGRGRVPVPPASGSASASG